MIAGIEAGYLCPGCQTADEDLDAELNLTLGRSTGNGIVVNGPEDLTDDVLTEIVNALVRAYPAPEIMRHKANLLAQARGDRHWMVGLMRNVADGMESGDLFEEFECGVQCSHREADDHAIEDPDYQYGHEQRRDHRRNPWRGNAIELAYQKEN